MNFYLFFEDTNRHIDITHKKERQKFSKLLLPYFFIRNKIKNSNFYSHVRGNVKEFQKTQIISPVFIQLFGDFYFPIEFFKLKVLLVEFKKHLLRNSPELFFIVI